MMMEVVENKGMGGRERGRKEKRRANIKRINIECRRMIKRADIGQEEKEDGKIMPHF